MRDRVKWIYLGASAAMIVAWVVSVWLSVQVFVWGDVWIAMSGGRFAIGERGMAEADRARVHWTVRVQHTEPSLFLLPDASGYQTPIPGFTPMWSVHVPGYMINAVILAAWWFHARRIRRRQIPGCRACGYSHEGLTGKDACPECGAKTALDTRLGDGLGS